MAPGCHMLAGTESLWKPLLKDALEYVNSMLHVLQPAVAPFYLFRLQVRTKKLAAFLQRKDEIEQKPLFAKALETIKASNLEASTFTDIFVHSRRYHDRSGPMWRVSIVSMTVVDHASQGDTPGVRACQDDTTLLKQLIG